MNGILPNWLEKWLGVEAASSGEGTTWALENKKLGTDSPATTDLFGADKYIKAEPKCPANETTSYVMGTVDATVTCANVGTETNHVLSASY